MKYFLFLCLFFWLRFTANAQKAVFVIADGIPADVLESVATPNIDAIAKKGTYMRAHVGGDSGTYNHMPALVRRSTVKRADLTRTITDLIKAKR